MIHTEGIVWSVSSPLEKLLPLILSWSLFKTEWLTSENILSSLRQCILKKANIDASNLSEEGRAQVIEEEEVEQSDIPDAGEEDENMLGRLSR